MFSYRVHVAVKGKFFICTTNDMVYFFIQFSHGKRIENSSNLASQMIGSLSEGETTTWVDIKSLSSNYLNSSIDSGSACCNFPLSFLLYNFFRASMGSSISACSFIPSLFSFIGFDNLRLVYFIFHRSYFFSNVQAI